MAIINNIKMLYYDRIDISEGIDVNKINESKEHNICHYWYLLKKGFKIQPNVFNICHTLLMMSMNIRDISFLNIKGSDYRFVVSWIRKSEAINLMPNTDLTEKSGIL